MKRAVLVTGHFAHQKRWPSLLWVSKAMQARGWHVTHVTVGYSWLSALKGDRRLATLDSPPISGTKIVSPTLTTVYGLSPVHPFPTGYRMLDTMLCPVHSLFTTYWAPRLRRHVAKADLVLIESGPPVMLARTVREMAPQTRLIYRVNDDMRLLGYPSFLPRLEIENSGVFDRISTASPYIARRLAGHAPVTLDPMGVPRNALRVKTRSPYVARAYKEAVCAGTTQLDMAAVMQIAKARPDWRIHIIGRLKTAPPRRANLVFHGEQGFDTTLNHIAYADIGLAPYIDAPGVEYQTTNSNRIQLYRHFGLPILGPDRLCHPSVPSIIGYGDPARWHRCETTGKRPETLPDWSELARRLTDQNPVIEPPLDVASVPARA